MITTCGLNGKKAKHMYQNIINDVMVRDVNVVVKLSKWDRPSIKCSFCNYKRTCDYDYQVNNENDLPLCNKCKVLVGFLVDLFKILKNKNEEEPKDVLRKLHVALSKAREAHANLKKRK